jgi:hypothetical protein
MTYEQVTESTLKRLYRLGALRSCSLLLLPDGAGYALSFAVSGGAVVLKSHREPVRVFKNPAIAFKLASELGFTSMAVSLVPCDPVRQLANQRTPETVPGAISFVQFCQNYGLKTGEAAQREYQAYLGNLDLFTAAAEDAGLYDEPAPAVSQVRTEHQKANLTGVSRQSDPNAPDAKKRAAARAKRKKSKR